MLYMLEVQGMLSFHQKQLKITLFLYWCKKVSGNNFYILAILLIGSINLEAQFDAHYWTHQYGAKGLLLNGAVIASSDDETNIFYNPGAMGLDDNLGFAFSFLSPTYAKLQANNFLSNNTSLNDEGIDFSPGFLAVRFQPVRNLTVGIASFERFKSNIRFKDRVTGPINDSGQFLLRADLDFERKLSEEWFAIALSYNLSDRIGIGISQFSSWRDASLRYYLKKEVVNAQAPTLTTASWRNEFAYDYSIYSGFITKIGMSFRGDNFKFGLTYTTPTYGIIDSGVSYALDDQRINPLEPGIQVISNRKGTELLDYKSPMSFGIGLEFRRNNTVYSISAEHFRGVDNYFVFRDTDDSFNGEGSEQAITSVSLQSGNESVTNFALGLQLQKNDKLTWIAGVRTDFNENTSLVFNELGEYLGSTPSVYHISGGAMYRTGKNTFSMGLDLGFGSKRGGQSLASFDNVTLDNLYSFSGSKNVDTDFISFMVFLTYDFIFQNISTKEDN